MDLYRFPKTSSWPVAESGSGAPETGRRAAPRRQPRYQGGGMWKAAAFPLLFFLIIPVVGLFLYTSPADVIAHAGNSTVRKAVGLSIWTTGVTTVLAVAAGMPVAYLIPRLRRRLRRVLETVIDLPVVLPPAVAGVALLITFGRRGLLGSYLNAAGITISFTPAAVVMAQLFVASPFFVKAASIGFSSVSRELKEAAALDGASGMRIFRHITLPLTASALTSGAILTWARALGEFGATIIFAGNFPGRTQTMPLAIYLGFEMDLGVALTLSIILVATSFLVMSITRLLMSHAEV